MALIRSGRLMRNRPRSWLERVRREAAWPPRTARGRSRSASREGKAWGSGMRNCRCCWIGSGRSPARMPGEREGWEGPAPPAVSRACAHSAAPFLRDSGSQVCRSSQKAGGSGKEPEKSRCRAPAPRDGRWFGPEPAGCQPRILRGTPLPLRADRERERPGGPEHQRASVNGQMSRGDGKS